MTLTRGSLSLILLSILLSAVAQIVLKWGMSSVVLASGSANTSLLGGIVAALSNPKVLAGLVLYAVSALVWLAVLAEVDVSLAYPFVGAGFVITLVLAWGLLGERFGLERLAGTALICAGIAVLARS